ncbi:MAG: hypothetical protein O2798_01040 [Chloroflexi bacterium]|nr:hypothetical protein [Chloroflexota bacterium]
MAMLQRYTETLIAVVGRHIEAVANDLATGNLHAKSLAVLASGVEERQPNMIGNGEFQHSRDYRTIVLRDQQHLLTAPQAAAVRKLHTAHQEGLPALSTRELLDDTQSNASKVSELFKRSSAWPTVVVRADRRGMYRLNLPPNVSPMSPSVS